MNEALNCMNCCIGNFKEGLCDCNDGICKEYKKVGSAEDFENEVLNRTKQIKEGEWLPMYCSSVFGGNASAWGSSIAGYMCSECDEEISLDDDYAYCPYCGSRNVKKDD